MANKTLAIACALACRWALGAAVGYPNAEDAAWEDVRLAGVPAGKAQLSVHVPLNLLEADALVYCDCAFNAWKLAVPADIKMGDKADDARLAALTADHLGIAVGPDPFLPDYRQTKWTRLGGGLPIVRGEFEASHRRYVFTYCTNPDDGELYVHGTVRNVGFEKGPAVVRFRRAAPRESAILDYHYLGFRWHAAKWSVPGVLPPPVCTEIAGGTATAESGWAVGSNAYARVNGFWGSPYVPEDHMRLPTGGPALRLEATLAPNEEFSFTVAAGFAAQKPARRPPFVETLAAAERYWNRLFTTTADFGDARANEAFRALQCIDRQLLLNVWRDPSVRRLQPCQGGTSERFYVWVWEAMCALTPLARLGHAEAIGKVLEYILELQDGGTPPAGNFTTVKGAIGTTGPRWANSTGSALCLAAAYLETSGDAAFEARHLEGLVRAARWIVGEIRATRKTDAAGRRVLGWGLLPGCIVNDGDYGLFYATTDTWSCAGLARLAAFLKRRGHPAADELLAEAALYREAIDAAIDAARRPDGFIARCIGSDKGGSFEFRNIPGAFGCLYAGVVDPVADARFRDFVRLWERTHVRGLFLEPFDANIDYIGNVETGLCRFYLERGEWKRAYLARQTAFSHAMTRDLYVPSERYSERDDSYTPWQPNASNSGRLLGMLADRFLEEGVSRLVLLGGFAPFESGNVSIRNLRTAHGLFSLARRGGRLTAEWSEPLPVGTRIVIPAHHRFVPAGNALGKVDEETWRVLVPVRRIEASLEP